METIRWLIGIAIAIFGVGLGLYYSGRALRQPEQSRELGRKMHIAGKVWIGIGLAYLIVVIALQIHVGF